MKKILYRLLHLMIFIIIDIFKFIDGFIDLFKFIIQYIYIKLSILNCSITSKYKIDNLNDTK